MEVAAPPTDDELAARAARRDRAAFDRLIDRHAGPLAACLLRRLPPDDAEEVIGHVLFKAWRMGGTFHGGSYRTWLFQIARTVLGDWLRRLSRPLSEESAGPDRAVAECVDRLADRERALIRARFGGDTESGAAPIGEAITHLRECVEQRKPGVALVLTTVPANVADLAGWLERQVAGPDLVRLIAELSAVHGPSTEALDLASALGTDRPAVLSGGLIALTEGRLRTFVRYPSLLAELQDAVAEAGSAYWDDLFDHPTLTRMIRRARQDALDEHRVLRSRPTGGPWYLRPWFVASLTAAIVLMTVILNRPPSPPAWGWIKPGAVSRGNTRTAHLNALAESAAEWNARPRETPADLRRALRGMRDGCTAVLAASHDALTGDDRVWLANQCVDWGTKLDRHLADLQAGRPVDDVRREADATVEQVVRTLQERAGD